MALVYYVPFEDRLFAWALTREGCHFVERLLPAAELSRLEKLYTQSSARFSKQREAAIKLATDPLGPAPKEMNMAELAAWTVVGNVLLNLDEALMKR